MFFRKGSIKLPKKDPFKSRVLQVCCGRRKSQDIKESGEECGTQLRQWTRNQTQKPFCSSDKQHPPAPVGLSLNQKETKHGIKIFPLCPINFSNVVAHNGIRNLKVHKKSLTRKTHRVRIFNYILEMDNLGISDLSNHSTGIQDFIHIHHRQ